MRFHPLEVPHQWQHYWSKYPEGYTILEALLNWVNQVNSMVDNVNDWNEYLDEFVLKFDKELEQTVIEVLKDWQESGFLDYVIDEALQTEMDELEKDVKDLATINVRHYGAVGDGVTDDTEAIQTAISALEKDYTLLIPAGTYNTSGVVVNKGHVTIDCRGVLFNTGIGAALTIEGQNITVKSPEIRRQYEQAGVASVRLIGVGIDILNSKNVVIYEPKVYGHAVGIQLHDTSGTGSAYVDIYSPLLINNLEGYKCLIEHASGWTNESKMFGGRIELTTANFSDVTGSAHFNLLGDCHRFYGVCAEGKPERKVKGLFGECTFDGCRFEQTNGDIDIEINGASNAFIRNRDWENIYQDNSKNNVIWSRWGTSFGSPIKQQVRTLTPVASNYIFRMNSDYSIYLVDCSKYEAYIQANFTPAVTNRSVFTVKKIDSTPNPVIFEVTDLDGNQRNPRLLTQNETITFMYLDGKWIVLSNEKYTYNPSSYHMNYGVGEERKFYNKNDSNYLKYEGEFCIEEGTTGSFSGVTGTGNQGEVTLTLSGTLTNMFAPSWITVDGVTHYVMEWDSETSIATLRDPLTSTVSGVTVQRKNPTFVKKGRLIITAGDPPTTGQWRKGDIVYEVNPVAGGHIGWVCVGGGSPGDWKAFGAIES